ncbi:hypothetical protein GN958_ATG17599 [Phytophthora infestans]|uniref:Uncharacterized protein n=1 Tax=Phytophthora infestans TaxID=4787 RepID=A0A8S9TWV7_PHYIN|nr:hypothetical protein GN958_ATG21442 [Phytophthora infestans]KAF4133211.1 hypothetical protein GN958_ATG17599 [Phytophthora infestans]
MWCRLVSDGAGNKYKPNYALRRTLRTYSLQPGTFDAPTRSTTLRTALQDAVNDAFKSTRRQLRLESEDFANTHADQGSDDQAAVGSGTSTSRTATMQNQVPPSGYIGERATDEGRPCEEITVGRSRTGGVAENGIIPAESIILMSSTSIVADRATESGASSAELSIQAYPSEGSADETARVGIAADVELLFDPASSTVIPDQTSSANDFSRAFACAEERPC